MESWNGKGWKGLGSSSSSNPPAMSHLRPLEHPSVLLRSTTENAVSFPAGLWSS